MKLIFLRISLSPPLLWKIDFDNEMKIEFDVKQIRI